MNIEDLREICQSLTAITEDIKWENDLVFSVGKMYCITGLNQSPTTASFKVSEEEFEELSQTPGFRPAPYVAKYHWVLIEDIARLSLKQWKHYLAKSHRLVLAKLPAKQKKLLGF